MFVITNMNTIINYSTPNYYLSRPANNVKFTGARDDAMKKFVASFTKTSELTEKLTELRNKHFEHYSFMDKALIKLGLKKDYSENMAIFEHLGVNPYMDKKGYIIIDKYGESEQFKIKNLGINEEKLFDGVSQIIRNGDFRKSSLTSLKNLKMVRGNLYLNESKIDNLGNLRSVGRHVYLNEHLAENDFAEVCVDGCILT